MEQLKKDLIEEIYVYYYKFTNNYKFEDELFKVCFAYIGFARKERHLFETIYVSDVGGRRTLNEVINSTFNQRIIEKMIIQHHLSREKAQQAFLDVRFYTHGIASQVLVDSILLSENEVENLLNIAIKKFKSND